MIVKGEEKGKGDGEGGGGSVIGKGDREGEESSRGLQKKERKSKE